MNKAEVSLADVTINPGKKQKNKSTKFKRTSTLQLWSLCAVPMLLVFVFSYLPMGGLIIAFKDYNYEKGIFGSEWAGLKNFEFYIKSDHFLRTTRNTLVLNSLFIFVGLIVAVTVALLLFEVKRRRRVKIFQTIMISPHYLSWVIVGYMSYAFLNPQYGFINSILKMFGKEAVDWYSSPEYWPVILTIVSIWKTVGINSVIYYASLMSIDSSFFEAAQIDGANKFHITINITLPFLVPLMVILTILNIGNIFRADFGLFYQLTRDVGALYKTTDVIDTYIYRSMRTAGNMSMSAAVGFLQSVVGFVLVLLTNTIVSKINPENALF